FALPDHLGVLVAAAAGGHGEPVAEALLRRGAVAHVPLADQSALVPVMRQDLRESTVPMEELHALGADVLFLDPVLDTVLAGHLAGEEGGAAGRAHRRGRKGACEHGAVGRQAIEHWRANLAIAVTAHRPRPVVVRKNEKNVGWPRALSQNRPGSGA